MSGGNTELWTEIDKLRKTMGAQSAQILELTGKVTELGQLAYSQSVLLAEMKQPEQESAVAYMASVGVK